MNHAKVGASNPPEIPISSKGHIKQQQETHRTKAAPEDESMLGACALICSITKFEPAKYCQYLFISLHNKLQENTKESILEAYPFYSVKLPAGAECCSCQQVFRGGSQSEVFFVFV